MSGQLIRSSVLQPEEFTSLTDDQRTAMKWKFLLERCKVHIKVKYITVQYWIYSIQYCMIK